MTRFFKHKLEGGALYVAVILCVVIGVLVSLMLLLSGYSQNTVSRHVQMIQLNLDVKSGFEMGKSVYFSDACNNKWMKNPSGSDSIKIGRKPWGAYVLLQVSSKNSSGGVDKNGLYGTFAFADTALVVSENSRQVSLSGKVTLKANCYLPSPGIKASYANGLAYQPAPDNERFIKKTTALPAVSDIFRKNISQQMNGVSGETDSVVYTFPLALTQSYTYKTVVVEAHTGRMENLALKNNIKIICRNELVIDSTCTLENIVIAARKVKFRKGFKGSVNVICSDSISVGERCCFAYPSSLVLLPENTGSTLLPSITLKDDCTVWGSIIALGSNDGKTKAFVKLNKGDVINGLVYSAGYTHVEGTINGTVMSDKLILKTPSAVYENHISDCEIDPRKYAGAMAVPMLFSVGNKLVCCKNVL